ncbi:MAG: glycoside hydrolase family 2 protein [Candidatus Symbiothrix sp.]|jgi:beta-galactosidase|nr:glycoside hydrolase family 2 protein [Candidatus Symbiothrix sp.]
MKQYSFFILALFLPTLCFSQINYPEKTRLNEDWEFLRSDLGSIWEAVRPASKGNPETYPIWEKIDLPHCFNADDAVDPDVNYYQGPGWYRKFLDLNNPYPNGQTILHFEGAGQQTDVYIYTQLVSSHLGGYDEWQADITAAVREFLQSEDAKRFDGKIPLLVRCDNSRNTEQIPSDLSDFNVYGGIYRYLNLIYLPEAAFAAIRTDAVTDAAGKKGKITITPAFSMASETKEAVLTYRLFSPSGKLLTDKSVQITDPEYANESFSWEIAKPELWSPDAPGLYSCELTLSSGGETMTCCEVFGFRHFEFKEKGPFFLNGKRLLLRGTHRHEDHAGLGAAMTEDLIVKELKLIKDMGANFIRLGHYQQSRIVLEQCDRLGILVWEEIPWCRGGLGGEFYRRMATEMLTHLIEQHRNHPSVILWGLGNENDWPNDFSTFDVQEIRAFMAELHHLAHRLDDSRLTTIRRCDFCKDIVDVYSPSIWAGWYRGVYTDYKEISYSEMQRVSRFLHAEWGGDSHARRYAENSYEGLSQVEKSKTADERSGDASFYAGIARASKDGDWSENYICDLFDWHLKEQETMPWLTGAAAWIFKDFSTPVRYENPVPYMNQKGVVERDLTPKEAYYVFQSYWADKPVLHIFGHTRPTRWGKEGEKKLLKVYANCETVELFLNGVSLGTKKRNSQDFPAAGLHWEVALKTGKNTLHAIGKKGKEILSDEIAFEYETRPFGKPAAIKTTVIDATDDYVWIEAELRDTNDVPCLDARNYFYFDSTGDGYLSVNQGTSTGSKKVQAQNGRARVKLIKNNGQNTVSIRSDGLETVFIRL